MWSWFFTSKKTFHSPQRVSSSPPLSCQTTSMSSDRNSTSSSSSNRDDERGLFRKLSEKSSTPILLDDILLAMEPKGKFAYILLYDFSVKEFVSSAEMIVNCMTHTAEVKQRDSSKLQNWLLHDLNTYDSVVVHYIGHGVRTKEVFPTIQVEGKRIASLKYLEQLKKKFACPTKLVMDCCNLVPDDHDFAACHILGDYHYLFEDKRSLLICSARNGNPSYYVRQKFTLFSFAWRTWNIRRLPTACW